MRAYIVESYAADADAVDAEQRARLAAEVGTGVRYIRTTYLPGDETVLHAFQADSGAALQRAVDAAQLSYDRIVEAVEASSSEPLRDASEMRPE
jgi:hypothetical protein